MTIRFDKNGFKKELSKEEEIELHRQVSKGQSLIMLSYLFKVSKDFILKFCKSRDLVVRKEYEYDYILELDRKYGK